MENVYLNRIAWNENIYTIPENKESKKKKKEFSDTYNKITSTSSPPQQLF